MRDPNRIPEILQVLGTIWMKHPDLRLGQIISNALPSQANNDPFYVEDAVILARLKQNFE